MMLLHENDVIISAVSTSCSNYLMLPTSESEVAIHKLLIDLSVPRSIDTDHGESIPGIIAV